MHAIETEPTTARNFLLAKARGVILEAVAEYQKHTCIRFQELGYRPTNEPHLYFATGRG